MTGALLFSLKLSIQIRSELLPSIVLLLELSKYILVTSFVKSCLVCFDSSVDISCCISTVLKSESVSFEYVLASCILSFYRSLVEKETCCT